MFQQNPYEILMILTAEKELRDRENEWFRQAVERQPARSRNIRTQFSIWFGRFLIDAGQRMLRHAH